MAMAQLAAQLLAKLAAQRELALTVDFTRIMMQMEPYLRKHICTEMIDLPNACKRATVQAPAFA